MQKADSLPFVPHWLRLQDGWDVEGDRPKRSGMLKTGHSRHYGPDRRYGGHFFTLLADRDPSGLKLANHTPTNSGTGSSNLLAAAEHPLDSPRSQSTVQTIRNWIKKADRNDEESAEGLSTDEREELRELCTALRQMKQERDMLAKATAWFAWETEDRPPPGL